ncbi:hypothetical protein ACFPL7_22200 [Dongia soli]|uniref:Head-tail adaptor protein n=1 Tax=Dongia soli TaxID=600628 RepID=A0ABU5E9T0_9PROT|nr:hypothetical protein [Dongia soli]MDY0882303.1 hypothetical protein [Dongia soli]
MAIDFDELVLAPCQEIFGADVLFQPKSGGIFHLRGIFIGDFQPVEVTTEGVVQGQTQVIGLRRHLLPQEVRPRDLFIITDKRGVACTYEVSEVQPDSEGDVQVHLFTK